MPIPQDMAAPSVQDSTSSGSCARRRSVAQSMHFLWGVLLVSIGLVGCGGGGGKCSPGALGVLGSAGCDAAAGNQAPSAVITSLTAAAVGNPVVFDGGSSRDPEGQSLSYRWELTVRPPTSVAVLSGATSSKANLVPDVAGSYSVQLVVNDGQSNSSAVNWTVNVTRTNSAPVAVAGNTVTALLGVPLTLDGSRSSDPEGDLISYAWVVTSRPTGSRAELADAQTVRPRLTPDIAGTYILALTVHDGQLVSLPSTVSVLAGAANLPPVSIAGNRQSVVTGATVTLDGTGSSDANGDLLTYIWTMASRPAASTALLSNAASARPSFVADAAGEYVFSLMVHDGSVTSAASFVTVTASAANVAPTAVAGSDRAALVGQPVTLNGGGSTDPNADALTFQWTLVSRPSGSAAVLSGSALAPVTNSQVVSITPDVVGTYVVNLVVSDGRLSSAASVVSILAKTSNRPPVAHAGTAVTVARNVATLLSGGLSTDPDSDPLTYEWTVMSKPTGSEFKLIGSNSVAPVFSADTAGQYVLRLVVSDGMVSSLPAIVIITVTS